MAKWLKRRGKWIYQHSVPGQLSHVRRTYSAYRRGEKAKAGRMARTGFRRTSENIAMGAAIYGVNVPHGKHGLTLLQKGAYWSSKAPFKRTRRALGWYEKGAYLYGAAQVIRRNRKDIISKSRGSKKTPVSKSYQQKRTSKTPPRHKKGRRATKRRVVRRRGKRCPRGYRFDPRRRMCVRVKR